MEGARVSETQLISSRNRMPSFFPVFSISSYMEEMISDMVYSDTRTFCPP